jgi:hypothetical protein
VFGRLILAAAVLAGACSIGASAIAGGPADIRVGRWKVDCWPGKDEFAVRCEARSVVRNFNLELSTADSQLFASIGAKGCKPATPANWWRDEIGGLPDRQARIERSLKEKLEQLSRTCPAARGARLTFDWLPDIATAGNPPPRWAKMHGKPN